MLRRTLLRCSAGRGKTFEVFCREQLLTNMALREMTPLERRKAMSQSFKELPADELLALKQRAAIEELRQESLERAAAWFKPLTPYEFFAREQRDNPAITGIGPREKEMKLLQIYESLPEKAREALQTRTEQYNTARSTVAATPALPVIPARKKPTPAPAASSSASAKKKKTLKKKKKAKKTGTTAPAKQKTVDEAGEADATSSRKARAVSPYSVFVKEQMASLHHLAPQERIRAIAERWRSLTSEERQRRLEACRAKLAAEAAAHDDTSDAAAAAASRPDAPTSSSAPATFTTTFAAPHASHAPPRAGNVTDDTSAPASGKAGGTPAATAAAPTIDTAGTARR